VIFIRTGFGVMAVESENRTYQQGSLFVIHQEKRLDQPVCQASIHLQQQCATNKFFEKTGKKYKINPVIG